MLLVLHGTGADGYIREDILYIAPVVGVEHLIGGGHFGYLDGVNVHLTHGDQAAHKVGFFLRIRLADDPFVALTGGAGLVGVNPGDQDQLVLHLFVDAGEPADIIADGVLVVGRTGADDDQEFIAFSGDDVTDLGVPSAFDLRETLRNRKLFPDLGRGR